MSTRGAMKKLLPTTSLTILSFVFLCTPAYSVDGDGLSKKLAAGKSSKELLQTFFSCVTDSVHKYTLEMKVPTKNMGDIAWESCSKDYFSYEIVRSGENGAEVTEADMDMVNCKGKYYTSYQIVELFQKDLSRAFDILKKNMDQPQ